MLRWEREAARSEPAGPPPIITGARVIADAGRRGEGFVREIGVSVVMREDRVGKGTDGVKESIMVWVDGEISDRCYG